VSAGNHNPAAFFGAHQLDVCQIGTEEALEGWVPLSGAGISVIADDLPLSTALPNSLALVIPENATGTVGFANEGFWGM